MLSVHSCFDDASGALMNRTAIMVSKRSVEQHLLLELANEVPWDCPAARPISTSPMSQIAA